MIELDHAATTPLDPRVLEAMLPWLAGHHGNPASDHAAGRRAREAVETARAHVASLIGATPEEIVWTSGATEANNLAIKGAVEFHGLADTHVVTSRVEHKSVIDTCRWLETRGVRVTWLKPDAMGVVPASDVLAALTPRTVLVSLMWVNNETGAMNPVEALAPALRERGVLFHVDAVQAAGKLGIDLARVPVDLLALSAHKLYGPKGAGALFVRKRPRARLAPQMHGGGHEQGMRSGTLAPHQIAGMARACVIAHERLDADASRLALLRERLWNGLAALPDVHRNGAGIAHILNVSFGGIDGESLRSLLPDLAVSSGSACSSATREPSYVLRALGRDDELAGASLRFSLGRGNDEAQIDRAAMRVGQAVTRLRDLRAGRPVSPVELDNVYGYAAAAWERFRLACGAGILEGEHVLRVAAGTPAGGAQLQLDAKLAAGRVSEARFRGHGCPVTIAVGSWIAQTVVGRSVRELVAIDAAQVRAALEMPDDKSHCSLMGEDLVTALVNATT